MGPRKHLGWELALAALVVLALSGPSVVESARILAVIPMPAPSHHMAISGVLKALANKGHDITLFSGLPKGNKINPSNTKLFHIELPAHSRAKDEMNSFWDQSGSELDHLKILFHFGMVMCNETLHHPLFKAEVNKPGQNYDLIIVEAFFFQESLVGLGHQFNAPVVAIHANGGDQWLNTIMGNPVNPALVPIPHLGFSDRMSLIERARNALSLVISHYLFTYTYVPMQDALLHEHWPDAPSLVDLMRSRIGVTLINNHFTLTFPLPLSRNIVEIGGIQMPESTNPLPKDLQEYLDGAEKGVVYFSMGSNLKLEFVPEQKSRAILDALGGLKEKVLLKWDGPAPKNISPNIRVIKWAPQADLLTHPNIRAFVTHGGLLSTQESVYHAVPVVGIPVFGDQTFNMAIASAKGFGIPVDFKTLTKETLSAALKEVLENPKYKESASRLSRLFRAKPMSPAESAVWAVEHVLQHGGDHLWPASVNMPLYQILMLDLVLLGFSPVIALLLIVWVLCRGKTQKVNKRKKNN